VGPTAVPNFPRHEDYDPNDSFEGEASRLSRISSAPRGRQLDISGREAL
jgi:hypothetical protein